MGSVPRRGGHQHRCGHHLDIGADARGDPVPNHTQPPVREVRESLFLGRGSGAQSVLFVPGSVPLDLRRIEQVLAALALQRGHCASFDIHGLPPPWFSKSARPVPVSFLLCVFPVPRSHNWLIFCVDQIRPVRAGRLYCQAAHRAVQCIAHRQGRAQ